MPKILGKKEITILEVKQLLETVDNLNSLQIRTLEYAAKFSKEIPTKTAELVEKLMSEIGIERADAVEVINIMPSSIEELRTFFSTGRKRLVITTQLEKMLKILDAYR